MENLRNSLQYSLMYEQEEQEYISNPEVSEDIISKLSGFTYTIYQAWLDKDKGRKSRTNHKAQMGTSWQLSYAFEVPVD